ncbi:MAG: hypothetical protein ACKOWE_06335 [Micrococcales bacterium]
MASKFFVAVVLAGALALTGCAPQPAPTPNPTHSAETDKQLSEQTDDFSKTALENLRKATPVLGMTEADATKFLESIGLTARVVERDGEGLIVDAMYSNSRIDLYIKRNVVIDITVG